MACICKNCGVKFTGRKGDMIVLKPELWRSINGGLLKGALCYNCIVAALGRVPLLEDLMMSTIFDGSHVPVNIRTYLYRELPDVHRMISLQDKDAMKQLLFGAFVNID